MKNFKVWFIGLLAALLIGVFYTLPLKDTSKISENINKQDKNETVNKEPETTQENLKTVEAPKIRLQVTMAQVSPDGTSVFGGIGPPGETVLLFNGDIIIAETTINEKGDWVAIPEMLFESGSHFIQLGIKPRPGENELSKLSVRVVAEKTEQNLSSLDAAENLPLTPETNDKPETIQLFNTEISDLAVVVDIEDNKEQKPLVVFVPKSDESIPVVVQSPEASDQKVDSKSIEAEKDINRLRSVASVLDAVDKISNSVDGNEFIQIRSLSWEGKSKLRLSGFARGGHAMRAYFDEVYIASISLNNLGSHLKPSRWSMVTEAEMQANRKYSLRAELLDKNDRVLKVSQIKITSDSLEIGSDGSDMVIIHKGDALWRIAYRTYGEGVRYVDIFKRNNARINDPNLIFPDQIFAIPE